MTPEQQLAEKRRLQKLQEENDLKTAMETLGITPMSTGNGIDGMHPTTKEEFTELAEAISKKLANYRASTEYQGFLEELLLKLFASRKYCPWWHLWRGNNLTRMLSYPQCRPITFGKLKPP